MGKTRSAALAGRAWKLLRMALFWARKGGAFRRGLLRDLRLVLHQIKALRSAAPRRSDEIHVGEREFSLDETPVFRLKAGRRPPRMLHIIPCINPGPGDLDDEHEEDSFLFNTMTSFGRRRSSSSREGGGVEEEGGDGDDVGGWRAELEDEDCRGAVIRGGDQEGETCIDAKAEEFIVKFYEQMELQRQISFLQYNEMLIRSTN